MKQMGLDLGGGCLIPLLTTHKPLLVLPVAPFQKPNPEGGKELALL